MESIRDTWPLPDVQHLPPPASRATLPVTLVVVSIAAWFAREWLSFVPGVVFVVLYLVAAWSVAAFVLRLIVGRHSRSPHRAQLIEPGRWQCSTWGGTQRFVPDAIFAPTSLEELAAIVGACGLAGRRIKPAGSLHSWSACAVTDDVSIQMGALNRVLAVDREAMTIRAEAGLQLRDLYDRLSEVDMALPSLPNVDTIQLGGAIANATHGTCLAAGTMCSLVIAIELVVFQEGRARVLTLHRHAADPHEQHLFDAAIVSFGAVGVIYALTLQCVEPYHSYVHESAQPFGALRGRFAAHARQHYSVRFSFFPSTDMVLCKIQVPIRGSLVRARTRSYVTATDIVFLKLLAFANERNPRSWRSVRAVLRRRLTWYAKRVRGQMVSTHRREALLTWYDAELDSRLHAAFVKHPFVNLEYAIPLDRCDQAIDELRALVRQYPRQALNTIVMRPVGADDAGYLAATKGQQVMYFDIAYVADLESTGMYLAIEKKCLELGGRCSWSRLIHAPASDFLENYPEYHRFVDAKRELDPANVFSNEFSDRICAAATTDLVARRVAEDQGSYV